MGKKFTQLILANQGRHLLIITCYHQSFLKAVAPHKAEMQVGDASEESILRFSPGNSGPEKKRTLFLNLASILENKASKPNSVIISRFLTSFDHGHGLCSQILLSSSQARVKLSMFDSQKGQERLARWPQES